MRKRLIITILFLFFVFLTSFFLLRIYFSSHEVANKKISGKTSAENNFADSTQSALPEVPKIEKKDFGCGKEDFRGTKYFVSPDGSDSGDGLSEQNPFGTIQKALDLANPGDMVYLLPGEYFQDFVSKKDGTKENPIIIKGESSAIVKGGGKDRVVEINHSFLTLNGFTIDGLESEEKKKKGIRDKLIYAEGLEKENKIAGLCIEKMTIKNAGGECVRLKNFAQKNEIAHNSITNCGAYDFKYDGGGKNGEGIYVGTAPEQNGDDGKDSKGPDQSNGNWIHHNTINTQGNECVDIKEGSSGNIVEFNSCTGQKDPESGGMDSRGSANIFRYNEIFENIGAGIRLGGDKKKDGINNIVYGNTLRKNKGGAVKIMREPQGQICKNKLVENKKDCVGECPSKFDPSAACK